MSGILTFIPDRILFACNLLTEKETAILSECSNTIFELAEFTAFYYFFRLCIFNRIFKEILRLCFYSLMVMSIIYLIMLTFPAYTTYYIRVHSLLINVVEFFFLFGMCLAYYRELFTGIPIKNLFSRPSFAIVTSAFFYSILMIPFFLISYDIQIDELAVHDFLFACHYVLLIILLISILRGFLSEAPITS